MDKLISMTDFVLEQNKPALTQNMMIKAFNNCVNYAELLEMPLDLGMFIPLDADGNVLQNICRYDINLCTNSKCVAYNEAEKKVLFKHFDFEYKADLEQWSILENKNITILYDDKYKTFEVNRFYLEKVSDLLDYNLELTESAKKQIGL